MENETLQWTQRKTENHEGIPQKPIYSIKMENLKKNPDESLGDYDILKLSKNETNNLNRSINRKKI